MATFTAILSILGPILLALLKAWQDGQPQRNQEERDEEIQKGRRDIAAGDAAAVGVRIDKIISTGDSQRVSTGTPQGGDADTLRRLATLGLGTGEAPGKS